MERFENVKHVCPDCKSEKISKYFTYEQKYHQRPHRLLANVWWWCASSGSENPTPKNDYYKCEDCNITYQALSVAELDQKKGKYNDVLL